MSPERAGVSGVRSRYPQSVSVGVFKVTLAAGKAVVIHAPTPSGIRGAGTRQRPDLPPRRRGRVLPLRPRCRGYRGVEAQSDSPGPQGGPDLFAVPVSASCSLIEDPPRLSARAESDVAGVRILDNLDLRLRRDDEVSNGLGGAVEELVRTGRTTRERDDIASS